MATKASQRPRGEIRLRDYRAEDQEELVRIDRSCFPPGIAYSREELLHYLKHPGSFAVVASREARGAPGEGAGGERVLGFIVAQKLRSGAGHVITIDVLPEARRKKLGSRLMREAEKRLRAAACITVQLEVAVDNHAALCFYKRHGYFVLKTIPRYYQGTVDALLLGKNLERAGPRRVPA
jgi:ribosomal-protein-alanine N-acetyltransferase